MVGCARRAPLPTRLAMRIAPGKARCVEPAFLTEFTKLTRLEKVAGFGVSSRLRERTEKKARAAST